MLLSAAEEIGLDPKIVDQYLSSSEDLDRIIDLEKESKNFLKMIPYFRVEGKFIITRHYDESTFLDVFESIFSQR